MKPIWLDKVLASMLLILLAIALGCSGMTPPSPVGATEGVNSRPFTNEEVIVPKGTAIYVRLQQSISSSTAQIGQSFSAVLDEPLTTNGQTVAPKGARVNGQVVAAHESGHLHDAGYLRLTLSSITLNGKEMPIQTSSIFVEGGRYGNRSLAYTGGGTGGSALIGAFGDRGNGGVLGTPMSGTGGVAAAYAAGKKEVGFVAERRMGFRLSQPFALD